MAYQFFAKAHQSSNKAPTSPPLSPPLTSPPSRNNRLPIQPPSLVLPQSVSSPTPNISDKLKPPTGRDPSFQPPAYPHPISSGYLTPHPHITIEPVSTAHIPSLTRIAGLLLPIRYPSSFYTATITDPVIASVSRVAIYHNHPVAAVSAPAQASASPPLHSSSNLVSSARTDKVIGGIRCRLERLPETTAELLKTQSASRLQEPTNLYIQTIHLLSPYRGHGVAASLVNSLLFSSPPSSGSPSLQVSELVKHYNIRSVTAHVHEANEEGLKWYIARGFRVEDGVVENYYRRLKPSGAKIVKLNIQWNDDDDDEPVERNQVQPQEQPEQSQDRDQNQNDDDDWEKVEAEDEDDPEDHGVQLFTDSKLLEVDDVMTRKRKADDEP